MLRKLLKYDLIFMFRYLGVVYGLLFFFSLLTRFFFSIDNSFLFNIVAQICSGVVITLIINIIVNNLIRCWVRFKNNLYNDESYLTHTLPVSKNELYISKLLSGILSLFISFVVILISVIIAYYSNENLELLKDFLSLTVSYFNSSIIGLVLTMFGEIFVQLLFILNVGYLGIIIGNRSNNYKTIKTFGYSFILYTVCSFLLLTIVFGIALFNPELMNLFKTVDKISVNSMKSVLYLVMFLYIIVILILNILSIRLFSKGVDVD